MNVRPITPTIGAEITGVSLEPPFDAALIESIHTAWMQHLVLVVRDQHLAIGDLQAFGRCFGALHVHPAEHSVPGYEGVLPIHTGPDSPVYAGRKWHSDVSCDAEPPMGSILHMHRLPDSGGDTLFANMYAAHDALSPAMQAFLRGLRAVHASEHNDRGYFGRAGADFRDGTYPENSHPVVRTHPVTGRKALFVNETFTTHVEGLTPEESDALLAMLYRHIAAPRFQCRVQWTPGAVTMWDNRCVQHLAIRDFDPQVRSGHRATVAGDVPV